MNTETEHSQNLVGDLVDLPKSNEQIRILMQNNGVDCGICNAINVGQFFGGNIPKKDYDTDTNKLKMNYRKRFYTTARIENGDKLESYWLTQSEGMQILKEIIPNNIIADYPSGGSFHPTTEEVSTFMGKPSISRNSIYFDEMKKARENKQWGIVNKFLL